MLTGADEPCNKPDIEFVIGEPGMLTGAVEFCNKPEFVIEFSMEN